MFSVLLNIPDVTKHKPGLYMLATVTIRGMYGCSYVCIYLRTYVCTHVCMYAYNFVCI